MKGVTATAAKYIYKLMVEHYRKTGEYISPESLAEKHELWIVDEWTHVGHCVLVCMENTKLVENFRKGNEKAIDALVGKVMKASNMTVDAGLVRELLPLVIERHFSPG